MVKGRRRKKVMSANDESPAATRSYIKPFFDEVIDTSLVWLGKPFLKITREINIGSLFLFARRNR